MWAEKKRFIFYEGSSRPLDFEGIGANQFLEKILNIDLIIKG